MDKSALNSFVEDEIEKLIKVISIAVENGDGSTLYTFFTNEKYEEETELLMDKVDTYN